MSRECWDVKPSRQSPTSSTAEIKQFFFLLIIHACKSIYIVNTQSDTSLFQRLFLTDQVRTQTELVIVVLLSSETIIHTLTLMQLKNYIAAIPLEGHALKSDISLNPLACSQID